jgi:cytochrome c-type protein NapB
MQPKQPSRIVLLVGALITFVAIVGYFVGLQSPMNPFEKTARVQGLSRVVGPKRALVAMEAGSIPATDYSQMGMAVRANLTSSKLAQTHSPFATASIPLYPSTEQAAMEQAVDTRIPLTEKRFALAMREKNRAFNGAPPTVPHPIDENSAESCVACHSQGTQTATLRIPKMSHATLSNCTQCHVGTASSDMPNAMVRANHFVGLAAPEAGPRAFGGAPPQIPHSTWMRVDCLSCHGQASYRGLQTTHPWRQNCQQCHAASSTLEQTILESNAKFIDPMQVDSL